MLYRAPVQDVKTGRVNRRYGHIAVVMQYYPRFLPRTKIDEYVKSLAPEKALFTEFKALERSQGDHDEAFEKARYEQRFELVSVGWSDLERLSGLSMQRDVFLVCQCALDQRCHADLLLLAARYAFKAPVAALRKKYDRFEKRLPELWPG